MDTLILGFLENDSNVSELLRVPKGKDDTEKFRNMSEQLLSAEG